MYQQYLWRWLVDIKSVEKCKQILAGNGLIKLRAFMPHPCCLHFSCDIRVWSVPCQKHSPVLRISGFLQRGCFFSNDFRLSVSGLFATNWSQWTLEFFVNASLGKDAPGSFQCTVGLSLRNLYDWVLSAGSFAFFCSSCLVSLSFVFEVLPWKCPHNCGPLLTILERNGSVLRADFERLFCPRYQVLCSHVG